MLDWIRERITSIALSAAAAIIALELITPSIFDFVFDLILLGLIGVVAKLHKRKPDPTLGRRGP